MKMRVFPQRSTRYAGIALVIALALYMIWDGLNGWGGEEICAGISLVLVAGAVLYLKRLENKSENSIAERIRAEYPAEARVQFIEAYEHLKRKELEGLFVKILDDAKGDVNEVTRLVSVAESVGWNAFLENRW